MRRSLTLGYFALALSQITISINVVTSKYLLATLPMFSLLAGRFFVSSVILGLSLTLTKTTIMDPKHPLGKLTLTDWSFALSQGICAAFLFNVFFVWGLQNTTATAAGIVGSTLPAIIALCAIWLLKERLNWTKITALVLAMIGIMVIHLDHLDSSANLNHTYFGDFLIFLAMFPEAWYSIISRKLAGRMTPLGSALIANVVGFLTLFPCAIFTGSIDFGALTGSEVGLILVAGISSSIFFLFWAWGLTFIPASTAGIFGGVMPVATTFFAIFFLDESLHWYDVVGMALVLMSILIGTGWRPFVRKAKLTEI